VADRLQMSGGSSADRILAWLKVIVSVRMLALAEMQTEIYHFSCTGMSFGSWDFGAHFSAPEMLGIGCTFFLYRNSKFQFTVSPHLFCNLTLGISATFQLVQNPNLFLYFRFQFQMYVITSMRLTFEKKIVQLES
jgi:hypothetical protein